MILFYHLTCDRCVCTCAIVGDAPMHPATVSKPPWSSMGPTREVEQSVQVLGHFSCASAAAGGAF
jgi:hypothetical protein